MRKQAQSERFGEVTYTVEEHGFFQAGYSLRHVENAWRADGSQLTTAEKFDLEAELKARGLL